MENADVVIIGGGVNGASTAFNLTSLGVRRVIVVERRHLGAGATGKSGSLVRMHYTNEAESRLAWESLKVFRDFANIVGGDCGFDAAGFVEVVGPEHAEAMAANVAMQQRIGIDTRLVSKEELRSISPDMKADDIGAAAYEPGSGFADPNATTFAFAEAARKLGATIETGCEALRIVTEGGRVAGVETSRGRISAPVVVAVPGAWAGRLLDPLGLDFGLTPYRIQVSIFRWPEGFTRRHPAVIDATHRAWLRPEGRDCTLIGVELGSDHVDPDKYDEGVDESYVALCRESLTARFPAFARSTMRGGWAGMIMMSADGRPIIDQVPTVPGLWVMLGDSGTSFKTSPAIGRCLAEWIVKGKPETADLSRFRSTRFAEGKPWVDATGYGIDRLTISR
jgi:glycine/D-amino acid oxidase-like deaminating enzyme